jgi:hypothetical protein
MHLLELDPRLRPSARAALQHHVFDAIIPYPYRNQQQQQQQHQQKQQLLQQKSPLALQQTKQEPSSPSRVTIQSNYESPRKRFGM